jgi:hypothetical protein
VKLLFIINCCYYFNTLAASGLLHLFVLLSVFLMQSKYVSPEDPIELQNGTPEDGQEGSNKWELLNTFVIYECVPHWLYHWIT